MADISAPLPDVDMLPGATLTVDVGGAGAVVTKVVVSGTYFPPDNDAVQGVAPLFVPLPLGGQGG